MNDAWNLFETAAYPATERINHHHRAETARLTPEAAEIPSLGKSASPRTGLAYTNGLHL
jgi:hypothetical protein